MTVNRNQIEIQREGLDALVQRLGRAGAIRFLQLFNKGSGDYTKERDALFEGLSVDDIADAIVRNREIN
ncbi:MAG: hypothetical protein FWD25_09350 [Clostridia bacterium]|nr:hypothetical protein [Clostridia bacterium]